MPSLTIFDHNGQCALYADGKLVHWGDRPSRDKLLDLLGVEYAIRDLPECFAAPAKAQVPGWLPPVTLEEVFRLAREAEQARLDAEILAAEQRLAELKRRRGDGA